jgi:hypothetical protein
LFAVGLFSGGESVWDRDYVIGAIALAIVLIAIPVAMAPRDGARLPAWGIAAAIALVLGLVVGVGRVQNEAYLDDRYQAASVPSDFPEGITAALEWFNEEEPEDADIAVVGGRPGFKQYVFYGDDLSNRVQYVADRGAHGAYRPIETCEDWRRALNDGGYDYLIAGPDQRTLNEPPVEAEWTTDPAATRVATSDDVSVFRIDGELDPADC